MAKEWTDEEVKQEIQEAVAIVRADRLEKDIRARFAPPPNDQGNPQNVPPNSGSNDPQNGNGDQPKKKRSLFWGVESE
jgi:hypothetical protein